MRKFAGIGMIELSAADVLRQRLVSRKHAWNVAPKNP